MSYCVHCGVELDQTQRACPLCGTEVHDPVTPVDRQSPRPYPTRSTVVEPPGKGELAVLLSVMLVSASAACALLNLFLNSERFWSLYVIGGAMTLWLWMVLPLLTPKLPVWGKLLLDGAAVGVYVGLIALSVDGLGWYLALALPIVLVSAAVALGLGFFLPGRSILTSVMLLMGASALECMAIELFVDRFLRGVWAPGWSIVVAVVCGALILVLVTVRVVPSLREQARRKFHL